MVSTSSQSAIRLMPVPVPRVNPNSQRLTQQFLASQENKIENDSESVPVKVTSDPKVRSFHNKIIANAF